MASRVEEELIYARIRCPDDMGARDLRQENADERPERTESPGYGDEL